MSTFTDAERDTILAALRLWQVSGILDHVGQSRRQLILTIAEENGAALTATEIDDLCERLNCGELEPPPVELSECCHATIGMDAWADSNGEVCGGPYDDNQCMNCGMERPPVWDRKSPPWPRSQREGEADLPEGVDEPPEPVSEVTP